MTALYRAFDATGRLLYVGITDHPRQRRRAHERYSPWRSHVAWWTFEDHPTREAALTAELEAIRRERPTWNVTGTPVGTRGPRGLRGRSRIRAGLSLYAPEPPDAERGPLAGTPDPNPTLTLHVVTPDRRP